MERERERKIYKNYIIIDHHYIYKVIHIYIAMVITSIQLSEEDWKFCKDMQFKFSDLLRGAIEEKRKIHNGVVVDNVLEERRKKLHAVEMYQEALEFIKKNNLIDGFLNIPKEEKDDTNEEVV